MADNVTTGKLEVKLGELAEGMAISTKKFVEAGFVDKATYMANNQAIIKRLEAVDSIADDDVESLAEKIIEIRKMIGEAGDDLVKSLFNRLAEIKASVTAVDSDLQAHKTATADSFIALLSATKANTNAITSLSETVSKNKQDMETAVAGVQEDVNTLAKETAQSAEDLAKAVSDETARAKAQEAQNRKISDEAIATAKEEVLTATAEGLAPISEKTDLNERAIQILNGDKTVENSVDFKVEQAKIRLQNEIKAVSDKQVKDVTANIQEQIDSITGGEEGSLKDLIEKANVNEVSTKANQTAISEMQTAMAETNKNVEANATETAKVATDVQKVGASVTEMQNQINDVTLKNGGLQKGLMTRTSELEKAVELEAQKRVAELEKTVEDLKAYSDSKDLRASSISVCVILSKFDSILGVASDCGGTTTNSGDGESL